ncbi:hypothetical protein DMUE_0817 [Dictyocoela muelleri]|nr:hypothetical protein DMUE_0817 [Dictyocoela muelleri]
MVIRVDNERGNVWITEGKRIVRHNVKNLKPCIEREKCHAPMTCLQISDKLKNQKSQKKIKSANCETKNYQLWKFLEISNYKRNDSLEPCNIVRRTRNHQISLLRAVAYFYII